MSLRLHPLPKATRTLVVETDDAPSLVARLLRSQLQPSALDVLHPGRVLVLFEGSPRAVETQVAAAEALVGGVEADRGEWETSRRRQGAARGRLRFDPGRLAEALTGLSDAVVRPSSGVAYTADELPSNSLLQDGAVERLVERIQHEFDPNGVLAG